MVWIVIGGVLFTLSVGLAVTIVLLRGMLDYNEAERGAHILDR